jgi:hypothetical protein
MKDFEEFLAHVRRIITADARSIEREMDPLDMAECAALEAAASAFVSWSYVRELRSHRDEVLSVEPEPEMQLGALN